MADLLPGAEPFSADGGPYGVLVLHGFTGSPQSVRGLAETFAGAGFAVELPLLPGHGTTEEDLAATTWDDWLGAAQAAYDDLAGRVDRLVLAGLSMGGALACVLAADHPDVAGLVVVNPAVQPSPEMRAAMEEVSAAGEEYVPGIGSDIADPANEELAYARTPVESLLSLFDAAEKFGGRLGEIACPVLILTSPQDHVVPPTDSDALAAAVSGPVERVTLERSYHVATLDYDRDLIEERALAFVREVTSG
jgi:carboxylesterase